MILVMTFPMFIFTVYPGIVLGDYLESHYKIKESQKRAVVIIVTMFGALLLSSYLQLG
jgi:hypothetical protein